MRYLRFLLGTVLTLLAAAAALNFVVDPGSIYRAGTVNPENYADALLHSRHGLYDMEGVIDERLMAKAMSSYSSSVECVVIGSSHVMQISSERTARSLNGICRSVINLGVSGGSIEDHITLTYLALRKIENTHPSKIILGVDPWTLAFGKDPRYSAYRDDYLTARANIPALAKESTIAFDNINSTVLSKLANLVNLEYTIRSLTTVGTDFKVGTKTITVAPDVNPAVGGEYPIRLRDGSLVYSAKYISYASTNPVPVPVFGPTYATDGTINSPDAINAYRDLLLWIRSKGVEPILLMTPYHENVMKTRATPNAIAILATEPHVMNLGRELGVKVIGTYDPKMFGCLSSEFFDFMHPTADCLAKLRVRSTEASASQTN